MKKMFKNILTKSKYNFVLVIAALLMLAVALSAVTYCWIESTNDIIIRNSNIPEETITAKPDTNGFVNINLAETGVVSLNDYLDNSSSLFLAPAKMVNTSLQIMNDNGTAYRAVTTNDIGNNYIEFDVPFTVDNDRTVFNFTADSKITVDSSDVNPVRVSVSVDGGTENVFDSQLNNISESVNTDEKRVAFSVSNTTNTTITNHYMKVRIWLDSTVSGYANYMGKTADINLYLKPEKDTSVSKLTVSSADYTIITAYLNGTAIDLDKAYDALPDDVITVEAQTGDGKLITTDENMKLNGHEFSSFLLDFNGTSSALSDVTSSTSGSIKTTKLVYMIPSGTNNITINTTTNVSRFNLGGINLKLNNGTELTANADSSWPETCAKMTYNKNLNCVYTVIQSTSATNIPKFKIVEGADFSSGYRDSSDYAVPMHIDLSTQFEAYGVTGATIQKDNSTYAEIHKYITYSAPTATDVLVVYYLDSNTVELNTDTVLKEYLTAEAAVSTASSGKGTATVTYGSTTDTSVTVPRRAQNRNVTFTATPAEGYAFVGWSTTEGGTTYESTNASYTVAVNGDKKLYANYLKGYTVTVTNATAVDYSTKEAITFTNGKAEVVEGSSLDFTVTLPDTENAYKVTWYINGTAQPQVKYIYPGQTTDRTWLVSDIQQNTTVEAKYERLMKLTVTPTGCTYTAKDSSDNAITFTENVAYVESGASFTLNSTTATDGYYNVVWAVNGTETQNKTLTATLDDSYTTSITSDTTVTVTYTRVYKVTVVKDDTNNKWFTGSGVSVKIDNVSQTLSEYYLPVGKTVDLTAYCTDHEDEITADWSVTYGDSSTASETETLTHSETVSALKGDITVTVLVKAKPTIPACSQEIVKETKVSFYAGYDKAWNPNTTIYLNKSSDGSTFTNVSTKSTSTDAVEMTYDGTTFYAATFTDMESLKYYISNNPMGTGTGYWNGQQISEEAQGGKFYGLYNNGTNTFKTASTTAVTTVTPASVDLNSTGKTTLTTTVSSLTSAIGTNLYIQYYALNNTTGDYDMVYCSSKITALENTATVDLSSYFNTVGNLTVKTVLTDGTVYYVADTDTISVRTKSTVTVEAVENATVTVSYTDGSIAGGASAQVYNGTALTLNVTPNSGYEFEKIEVIETGTATVLDTVTTNNSSYIMPTKNITIKAYVKKTYRVVYFKNTGGWSNVYAYVYNSDSDNNSSWPGEAMTLVEGTGNVYSYTITNDSWANVIFNNGSGTQTADLTVQNGQMYVGQNSGWSDYTTKAIYYYNASLSSAPTIWYYTSSNARSEKDGHGWPGPSMTQVADHTWMYILTGVSTDSDRFQFNSSGSYVSPTGSNNMYNANTNSWSTYSN